MSSIKHLMVSVSSKEDPLLCGVTLVVCSVFVFCVSVCECVFLLQAR